MERPYSATFDPGAGVLSVHGEIGELDTKAFRRDLLAAVAASEGPVTVDLTDVDFLPSMAIGVLVGARKGAPGRIELVAAAGTIAQHLLQICGLEHGDPASPRPA